MFKKILVPIDGSPNSYRGFQQALDLAEKYGSVVKLLHVIEQPIYMYVGSQPAVYPETFFADQRKFGEDLLLKRKKELSDAGISGETVLVEGDPSEEIMKASNDCDLIVIGSRGLGRVRSLLLGSVSSKVAHYAKGPVLIVRPE